MSSLALRGQNLIGESEFVPIVNASKNFEKYLETDNIENNNFHNKNNPHVNTKMNSSGSNFGFNDMYSKLNEITELNSKMDPGAKYKTIKKNFENQRKNKFDVNEKEDLNNYLQNVIDNVVPKASNINNINNMNDITFPYEESAI
jgi:hypothetical protein